MRVTLIALWFAALVSCGRQEDVYVYEDPAPGPDGGADSDGDDDGNGDAGGGDAESFASLKPVVDKNCGGCHNGSVHPLKLDTEAAFRNARVKARIAGGTMPPPPARMSTDDKQRMLSFLD